MNKAHILQYHAKEDTGRCYLEYIMYINNFLIEYFFVSGTDLPLKQWNSLFEGSAPALLSEAEREAWLQTMDKVALASDAFFPFRDNIDRAVQVPTKHVPIDLIKIRNPQSVSYVRFSMFSYKNPRTVHHTHV